MRNLGFELAVVFVNCVLQVPVALILWRHHRDSPAWGLRTLALSFGAASAINLVYLLLPPFRGSPGLMSQPWYMVVLLSVGFLPLALLVLGLRQYFGRPVAQGWRLVVAAALLTAAMPLASFLMRAAGVAFAPQVVLSLTMGYCLWMSWRADRLEPGVGHRTLAVICATAPVFLVVVLAAGIDWQLLRPVMPLPFTMIGIVLLSLSLRRSTVRLEAELAHRRRVEVAYQKLNEELEQRVEQRTAELRGLVDGLESFSRMVSHDLRGPLHGLASLSRLAQGRLDRADTAKVRDYLGLMDQQTRALADLVDELLQLSRVTSGEFRRIEVHLASVAQEALHTLALSHGEQAVGQVALQPLPTVRADPVLLRQVLINIIGNALKFCRGRPGVHIEVSARVEPGGVEVSIRDNGPGFPADQAAALFEPFKRLHSGFEGAGIGLSIVKRIVERHGGRVWAESAPGQGAAFHFSLPT